LYLAFNQSSWIVIPKKIKIKPMSIERDPVKSHSIAINPIPKRIAIIPPDISIEAGFLAINLKIISMVVLGIIRYDKNPL
jgi:hypothetical protein